LADKADKRRAKIQETRVEVLEELYKEKPSTRKEIKGAVGYAVFSNIGVNVLLVSAGGGIGVVHDNQSGRDTYMKMGSAGVGVGLGIKDFRGVFIFHTRKALDRFIDTGWDWYHC
jgi:lipid-binding SYLF domain-containing protein